MQNNVVNQDIFHFLGARISAPMLVYRYENPSGYFMRCSKQFSVYSIFQKEIVQSKICSYISTTTPGYQRSLYNPTTQSSFPQGLKVAAQYFTSKSTALVSVLGFSFVY